MGYTLCVLGVRVHFDTLYRLLITITITNAPPRRMWNNGHSDNIRRSRQPRLAEPSTRPDLRPAQVGVPHARNCDPDQHRRRRPVAALRLHRVRQARRKREELAREISSRRWGRRRPSHRRTKHFGGAAVRRRLAVVRTRTCKQVYLPYWADTLLPPPHSVASRSWRTPSSMKMGSRRL